MISLGDGPFRPEQCRREILNELYLANVTNIVTEEKEVEVLDPNCEAGVLAGHGIMVSGANQRFLKETRFDVSGKLRGWALRRAWRYWVVETKYENALIGIEDAMALHKEYGKALRVAGHCGCPAPEPPWLFHKDRIEAHHMKTKVVVTLDGEFHSMVPRDGWIAALGDLDKAYPSEYLGMGLYHIDTQEAFNAFCAYLIKRGAAIDQAEETFQGIRQLDGDYNPKFTPKIDGYIRQWKKESNA